MPTAPPTRTATNYNNKQKYGEPIFIFEVKGAKTSFSEHDGINGKIEVLSRYNENRKGNQNNTTCKMRINGPYILLSNAVDKQNSTANQKLAKIKNDNE